MAKKRKKKTDSCNIRGDASRKGKLPKVAGKNPDLDSCVCEDKDTSQQAKEEQIQKYKERFAQIAVDLERQIQRMSPALPKPTWDNIQPLSVHIKNAVVDALKEKEPQASTCTQKLEADGSGPYMPARWFRDKFGIPASRLRAALRGGRLAAINVGQKRPRYNYSVSDAISLWPEDGIYLPDSSS